jgi:DNA-binding beta-propeller fold protein YncE
MNRLLGGVLWVGLSGAFAVGVGCSGTSTNTAQAPKEPKSMLGVTAKSCGRSNPGVGAVRYSELRQSGAIALARNGTRTIAYVADEDSKALHTIDVDKKEQIARTTLKGSPSQVLVLADGRVAVSIKDKNMIEVLEPNAEANQSLTSICTQEVATEPVGLAATNDDKTVLVASAWGAALTALDAESMAPQYAVDLPREPRAVLVDDSGERAFVAHGIGDKLSVVDIASAKHEVRAVDMGVTSASQFAGRAGVDRKRSASQGYALVKSETVSPGNAAEQPRVMGDIPKPPVAPTPAKKPPPTAPKQDASPAAVQPQGRIFVPPRWSASSTSARSGR